MKFFPPAKSFFPDLGMKSSKNACSASLDLFVTIKVRFFN